MRHLVICSIHDSASESYGRPFMVQARGEAVRLFGDLANDLDHPVGQHPDHYTLYVVGEFDQSSGVVSGCDPVSLGNGAEFAARGGARLEA